MEFLKSDPDPIAPYQKMYTTLFKAITAALYMMEDNGIMKARALLMQAQRETERLYIEAGEET